MAIGTIALGFARFCGRAALSGGSWALPTACWLLGSVSAGSYVTTFVKTDRDNYPVKKYAALGAGVWVLTSATVIGGLTSLLMVGTRLRFSELSTQALKSIVGRASLHLMDSVVLTSTCFGHFYRFHYEEFGVIDDSNIFHLQNQHSDQCSGYFLKRILPYLSFRALRGLAEAAAPGCTFALMQRIWSIRS